jgi:2-dehydro-3-deoxyphosphooctonate aldolase (KDO 8-P synthase)
VQRPLISVGPCRLGGSEPLYILGPCVIESEEFVWRMARQLKLIAAEAGVQFVFKASYDKANRTSGKSFRGMDVRSGCEAAARFSAASGVTSECL